MTADCAHCGETIEYRGARPKFCGFCGRPLDASGDGGATTVPGPHEAATVVHTPSGGPRVSTIEEPPPERIGGYRLLRELGRGGMGTVYEAEEDGIGRKVALKLLAPEITAAPEALERFRQEGRLASTMAHPRCVFVLNADEQEGRPFIVMELMPGNTLQDLVTHGGPLSIGESVPKVLDVIEGLREAHRLGLIHRDVKPSNCFLDGDGRVKVGDFGLSKSLVTDSNLTRTGSFLGTPLYASPEQIKGETLDPRTDVYSVAATLYYLLAGRAPFQGTDAAATLAKIVSEPPPPIRSTRPEIPSELERIILRGLERNRDRRYRDLGEMAAALLPFAPGRLQIGGLGLRAGAFVLEVGLSKFLILAVINMGVSLASGEARPLSLGRTTVLGVWIDVAIFGAAFFLMEPIWGASPGKRLLGLRVRGQGTSSPGPGAILRRNLLYWAITALPWQALAIALGSTRYSEYLVWVFPLRMASMAAVCMTMRTGNGYAGLHDLATGTRVVTLPRMKVRKAAGARRALGRDRVVAARPIGVMKAIGPYKVRGAVRWEDGRKVLSAEDSSLGREVWIVLRPKASPLPEPPRRELARATRPRWLGGGEQAEGRWDAFIAPAGCPLADLAGPEGLPWRDARPILEDMIDELQAALRDGTLPEGLTVEQVWIQPDGRAMLVDQLGVTEAGEARGRTDFDRARDFLREAAALALMGGRLSLHRGAGDLRVAIPVHARAMLDRLAPGTNAYVDFAELQADLEATQDRAAEVTRGLRGVQVAATVALLFMPVIVAFSMTSMALGGVLAAGGFPTPLGAAPPMSPGLVRGLTLGVVTGVAAILIVASAVLRGGMILSMFGCALAMRDGRVAPRWRCAWRSIVVWGPPAALLAAAVLLQGGGSAARWPSWMLFGVASLLVASYAPLAIAWPARGWQDRLAGTELVPK